MPTPVNSDDLALTLKGTSSRYGDMDHHESQPVLRWTTLDCGGYARIALRRCRGSADTDQPRARRAVTAKPEVEGRVTCADSRRARPRARSTRSGAKRQDLRPCRRGNTRERGCDRARPDRSGTARYLRTRAAGLCRRAGTAATSRRSISSATCPRFACTPEPVGSSTVKALPRLACRWRSDSSARKFSGNQTGPRQFELPPKSAAVRLRWLIVQTRLAARQRDDERMFAVVARERAQPIRREELGFVEHAGEHPPQP